MSIDIKFNVPQGIGWRNALGVCLAQADHMFAPVRVAGELQQLQRQSADYQYRGILRTLNGWQPEPAKVDEWLKIMVDARPSEERYQSAKLKLKICRLTSSDMVAEAAIEVLRDMTLEVMFFDEFHSLSFTKGAALLAGIRYSEISELLWQSSESVYSMAEELRSDAELLQCEEEGKILFAKTAYLSLISHFQFGEFLEYEIDSILQVAIDSELSEASRGAADEILEKLKESFPRLLAQRAYLLAQEYRREIDVDVSSQPWEESRMLVESYGYAMSWLPRGSEYVTDELQSWRAIFGKGSPGHAMVAIIAASHLVINIPQDGRGKAILRDVADETFKVIGSGSFQNPCEAADILFPRILLASEYDPRLAFHIASKLRVVALKLDMPLLFTTVYADALEYVDTTRRAEEIATLQNIRASSSLSQETIDAVNSILEGLT